MPDEREWWEISGKGRKNQTSVASGMNGERHFEGKLSFALAHTQACYKDSESFTILTYRGFLFDFSGLLMWTKQRKPLYVAVTAQSISGTSKILKTAPSRTAILIEKTNSAYSQCINILFYSVLILLRIFNLNIISNSCERRCPLSLVLVLTQNINHNASYTFVLIQLLYPFVRPMLVQLKR